MMPFFCAFCLVQILYFRYAKLLIAGNEPLKSIIRFCRRFWIWSCLPMISGMAIETT